MTMTKKPKRYTLAEVQDRNELPSPAAARKHSQREVLLHAIRDYGQDEFSAASIAEHLRGMKFTDDLRACGPSALSKRRWAVTGKVAHLMRWVVAHDYAIRTRNGYIKTSKARR